MPQIGTVVEVGTVVDVVEETDVAAPDPMSSTIGFAIDVAPLASAMDAYTVTFPLNVGVKLNCIVPGCDSVVLPPRGMYVDETRM